MAINDPVSPTAGFPISAKDFNSKQAKQTQKLVDYYEGRQIPHVKDMLDGKCEGFGKRVEWRNRGIVPRSRNVTKSIVDKSGLLFNKQPKLFIAIPNEENPVTDDVFNSIMESADWLEVFQNVDAYTRLTKAVVLLQQKYIPTETVTVNGQYRFDQKNGDALLFSILHQGNSVVKMNPQRTAITAIAFLTDDPATPDASTTGTAETWSYRLITSEEIIDVLVESNVSLTTDGSLTETIVARQPNPDGFVPASFFYDINKPRTGYWFSPPEDIMSLQEMVNLHLCDQEFAMAWQKQKTAFVTGDIKSSDENRGDIVIPTAMPGHTEGGATWDNVPLYQSKTITSLGGLGGIIKLGTDDQGQPGKITFEGPDTDLKALQEIVDAWVDSFSNDWDVNLKYGGGGTATSGFQLVVEENNNLTLRDKRSQSMIAGFRRFYQITQQLYLGQLTEGTMQVEFAPPSLPVNIAEQEQIWSDRIANNRASNIDYLMEVKGLTEAQAQSKMDQIIAQNNAVNAAIKPVPVAPPTEGALADKNDLKPVKQDLTNG